MMTMLSIVVNNEALVCINSSRTTTRYSCKRARLVGFSSNRSDCDCLYDCVCDCDCDCGLLACE